MILISPPGEYGQRLQEAGFHWQAFPFSRRGINPLTEGGTLLRLANFYRSEKPDLVHHFTIKCVLYGSLAARRVGVPLVVNAITGLGYVFLARNMLASLLRGVVLRLYRRALEGSEVIFQNPDDLALFEQRGLVKAGQSTLIRGSGIDTDYFRPLPEQGSVPLVVLPGRLLWDKGVGEFVEAAQRLKDAGVRARFALVGNSDPANPASVPLDRLGTWQKEGVVEWWGWQEDMRSVYALAHIICLPSYREGVPRALSEAAACGRPLVATDVPGCREVVLHNRNGLLVRPRDAEALAHALRMLIENPSLRRRMGDEGRHLAETEFSDERITAETSRSIPAPGCACSRRRKGLSLTATSSVFLGFLSGLIITLITCFFAIHAARRIGLMDLPGRAPHKLHTIPMPYAGGMALIGSIIILMFIYGLWKDRQLAFIMAGAMIIFVEGLIDDFRSLPALPKLTAQVAASILLMSAGIRVAIFEAPSFFWNGQGMPFVAFDLVITLFWLVGITNAVNLIDSMDGIVAGLSGWAFAFFMLTTLDGSQANLSIFSALMVGISIGLVYYNRSPARLFLGDSGAQTIGFILAAVSILYAPQERLQTTSWFVPILILGVPIFDTTLVVLSRLRRGYPFYIGRLDHTYHRLVVLGMDANRAVMTIHLAAVILECLAFIAVSLKPLGANSVFALCLLCGLAGILWLDSRKHCK